MGLMDKLKNMFTEEVEEEIKPIKKDVIQVEIPAPKSEPEKIMELRPQESIIEQLTAEPVDQPKKDEKFVFPVYFDDKDFAEIEKPKEKSIANSRKAYTATKQQPFNEREVKPKFKPSPVISPVYGVLDKNYSRDSIVSKKRTSSETRSYRSSSPTIDDVRRKAFGSLEEELEKTLTFESTNSFFLNEEDQIKQEVDIIDELDLKAEVYEQDDIIEEMIDDHNRIKDTNFSDNMIEEELNKIDKTDQTLVESDLFNLIDSMYNGNEE